MATIEKYRKVEDDSRRGTVSYKLFIHNGVITQRMKRLLIVDSSYISRDSFLGISRGCYDIPIISRE